MHGTFTYGDSPRRQNWAVQYGEEGLVSFYKATNHHFTCFAYFSHISDISHVCFVSCSPHVVSLIMCVVSRIMYNDSRITYVVSWITYAVSRITYVVSCISYILSRILYYLDIGMPKLNTDSEVAVTALSEGFTPLVILTLRLESLPYQRADTRLSRLPEVY